MSSAGDGSATPNSGRERTRRGFSRFKEKLLGPSKSDPRRLSVEVPSRSNSPLSGGGSQASLSSQASGLNLIPRNAVAAAGPEIGEKKLRPIDELWDEAWEDLAVQEPDLVKKYEALLNVTYGLSATQAIVAPITSAAKARKSEEIRTILEQKIKAVEAKEWAVNFDGHQLAAKGVVQSVAGVVEWAKDFVGDALSSSPSGSLAWAGVCLLLPLLLNPSKQDEGRAKGLEQVSNLLGMSRMRENLYRQRYESRAQLISDDKSTLASSRLEYLQALKKLYSKILFFQVKSVCYYSRNSASRIARDMWKADDWDNMLSEIQKQDSVLKSFEELFRDTKFEENCQELLHQHEERLFHLDAIGKETSRLADLIQNAQYNTERSSLLSWLSSHDPSILYNIARNKHRAFPSTGDWLIYRNERFKYWYESPSSILWLHGKAGCGKSILSSSIINHTQKRHSNDTSAAIAYFYFTFTEEETQDVAVMISSLVVQLCAHRPDSPKALLDLKKFKDRGQRPDLESLEAALVESIADFKNVFLVIDGLDECTTRDSKGKNFWLAWNEWDIELEISPLTESSNGARIDLGLQKEEIDEDIGAFIDKKIESSSFKTWPDDIRARIREALIAKADCMFQYVALQFDSIQHLKTQPAVENALDTLPKGLSETYIRILDNISPEDREQVRIALTWLSVSERPLRLLELVEASSIAPDRSPPFEEARKLMGPKLMLPMLSSLVITYGDTDASDWYYSSDDSDSADSVSSSIKSYDYCDPYDFYTDSDGSDESDSEESNFSKLEPIKADLDPSEKVKDIQVSVQKPIYPGTIYVRLCHFSVKEFLTSSLLRDHQLMSDFYLEQDGGTRLLTQACLTYHLYASIRKGALGIRIRDRNFLLEYPLWGYSAQYWATHYENMPKVTDEIETLALKALEPASASLYLMINYLMNPESTVLYDWRNEKANSPQDLSSPLYYTAFFGFEKLASLTSKAYPMSINHVKGYQGTALNSACRQRHLGIVKLLVSAGADVNLVGGIYHSAVTAAAIADDMDMVTALIQAGANINVVGGVLHTPLFAAVAYGSFELVQLLLSHGADPNVLDTSGCAKWGSAFHEALSGNGDNRKEALLKVGADINIIAHNLGTPLHNMIYQRRLDIICYLLRRGADVNARAGVANRGHDNSLPKQWYCSPLGYAVHLGCATLQGYPKGERRGKTMDLVDIVKLLRSYGADVTDLSPRELKQLKFLGFAVERIDERLTITGDPLEPPTSWPDN